MKKLTNLLLSCCLMASTSLATAAPISTYHMNVPVISLQNPDATTAVNNTINKIAQQALHNYSQQPLNMEGDFSYDIKYQANNLLSIVFNDYQYAGGAHGFHTQQGVVFDTRTGQELPLSFFLKLKSNDQILQGLADKRLKLFAENMSPLEFSPDFTNIGTALPTSYYLAGNGALYVIYPPYALSSYNNGATRVYFSADVIQQINNGK